MHHARKQPNKIHTKTTMTIDNYMQVLACKTSYADYFWHKRISPTPDTSTEKPPPPSTMANLFCIFAIGC